MEKIFKKKIFWILLIIFILIIVYSLINYIPYWDEAVYINNGKYLYSLGEVSTYEYQRPPLMGIITGFFWFLGLNEILFSKMVLIIIFLLGLFYLYKISEDLKQGSGIITTLLFTSLSSISFFTNRLLTEIPGACISIIGYYFFTKKRYLLSGFILSLAFLFRYPTGLVFGVLGIFLFIELIKTKKTNDLLKYGLGFSILTVPFIILNYILIENTLPFFKKILFPFTSASNMVLANAYDLTTTGIKYYLKFLFTENLLLVFFIIFIIFTIVYKKIRKDVFKNKLYIPVLISILYFFYISSIVHYEPRYFISALPFFTIIAGITMIYIIEKINFQKINLKKIIEFLLILFVIFTFFSVITNQIYENKLIDQNKIKNYYKYIQEIDPEYQEYVLIDNPVYGIYNEKHKIEYLSGINFAKEKINIFNPKYILFEERNYVCWREDDSSCFEKLNSFQEKIKKDYYLIYTAYFYNTKHYIYKLK